MSDEKIKVDIDLDVRSTGKELVDALTRKLDGLSRQIRSINSVANNVSKAASTPGRNKTQAKGTSDQKSVKESAGLDRQAVSSLR